MTVPVSPDSRFPSRRNSGFHWLDSWGTFSRNNQAESLDLTVELRTGEGGDLVKEVVALTGVNAASLLAHDGEATF